MYVVFHCNAATPLAKRYKQLSGAIAKARTLGPGWWADTEKNFLKLPYNAPRLKEATQCTP